MVELAIINYSYATPIIIASLALQRWSNHVQQQLACVYHFFSSSLSLRVQ